MQAAAERWTDIWCQVSGRQWQNACTARAGLGRKSCVATKITPEVPSESSASPSPITPTPAAPAALSPPPAATGTCLMPQAEATSARSRPVIAQPSNRRGICARVSPVAASIASLQSRAATSSQRVPALSAMSEAMSPVIRRRT